MGTAALSAFSDQLIIAATVLYVVAMVGFAVEVATWSRVPRGVVSVPVGALSSVHTGRRRRYGGCSRYGERGAGWVPPGPGGSPCGVALDRSGWVLHAGSIVARGLAAGRAPWGNMYEFSSAICFSAVTVFLTLQWRRPSRRLGLFVLLPVVLGLGVATMVLYTPAGPLVPALHSYWLVIHVAAAITASGLFTVASVLAAVYLAVTGWRSGRLRSALRTVVPDPEKLDDLCFRLLAVAFPIWTFAVVAGAIWAESAWGRYWGLGPEGDLGLHHLGGVRGLPARPGHRGVARPTGGGPGAGRRRSVPVQLLRGQHVGFGAALLRRRQMTSTTAPATEQEPAQPEGVGPPGWGLRSWARWAWRQLTSMRTALFLLFLLAVAAIPGSLLPQRPGQGRRLPAGPPTARAGAGPAVAVRRVLLAVVRLGLPAADDLPGGLCNPAHDPTRSGAAPTAAAGTAELRPPAAVGTLDNQHRARGGVGRGCAGVAPSPLPGARGRGHGARREGPAAREWEPGLSPGPAGGAGRDRRLLPVRDQGRGAAGRGREVRQPTQRLRLPGPRAR